MSARAAKLKLRAGHLPNWALHVAATKIYPTRGHSQSNAKWGAASEVRHISVAEYLTGAKPESAVA